MEDQGSEDVDGVSTTKYHAVIDLDKIAGLAPADQREAVGRLGELAEDTYGISELPLDVWIDDQGLPRKLFYEIDATVQDTKVNDLIDDDALRLRGGRERSASAEVPSDQPGELW